MKTMGLLVLAAAFLSSLMPNEARDAQLRARAERAITFMGDPARVRAIEARRTVMTELLSAIGQEEWPGGRAPTSVSRTTEIFNHTREAYSQARQSSPNAPSPALVVSDSLGMVVISDSMKRRVAGDDRLYAVSEALKRSARLSPEALLSAIARADDGSLKDLGTRVRSGRVEEGVSARLERDTVEVWFATDDGRLTTVEQRRADPVFGERHIVIAHDQWVTFDSIRFPTYVETTSNGFRQNLRIASAITVNPVLRDGYFEIPDTYVIQRLSPEGVPVRELAPGVLRLEGGRGLGEYGGGVSYYSIAVRQSDGITLIDASVSDERARAVRDTLGRLFPGVSVKAVVVTHGHLDHVSGVRLFADAGSTIYAAQELSDFVSHLGRREGEARRSNVTAVSDSLLIGSGLNRIVLYRVPTSHAKGMLVAYLPGHKLLIEADLQGLASPEEQAQLRGFVARKQLDVASIAGAHGPVVSWEAFNKRSD